MGLQGRVAIVTGGGQGIGEAICRAFAADGARVVIADTAFEVADAAARRIVNDGGSATAVDTDVSNAASVNSLVIKVEEEIGPIEILVNNAGISAPAPILDLAEADWDHVLQVNLKGPFLCSQAVGRRMVLRHRGRIINIASVVSQMAHPTQSAYCASKAGLVLLTKVMAAELGGRGVTVNAISPGAVDTPRLRELRERDPEFLRGRVEATPIGRLIRPEEVAAAARFLASDSAAAVTGANLVVDGGSSSLWAGAVPSLQSI